MTTPNTCKCGNSKTPGMAACVDCREDALRALRIVSNVDRGYTRGIRAHTIRKPTKHPLGSRIQPWLNE